MDDPFYAVTGVSEKYGSIFDGAPLDNFNRYFQGAYFLEDILNGKAPLAQKTEGNVNLLNSIKVLSNHVHPLDEDDENGGKNLLGNAIVIGNNIIIAARHCVDGKILSNLRLNYFGSSYALSLIEDGADFNEDYVLFQVEPRNGQENIQPTLEVSTDLPHDKEDVLAISCTVVNRQIRKTATMGPVHSSHHGASFKIIVHLDTEGGYCGSPYLTAQNKIIGFHLRSPNQIMFQGQKEGFFFREAPEHSVLYSLLNIPGARYRITPEYEFDDLSMPDPFYTEEAKGKREYLFGATPTITSGTGQKLLERWEKKNPPNAKYSGNQTEKGKYKDKKNWKINLEIRPNPKKAIPLDSTTTIQKSDGSTYDASLIHMGHKLSCLEYWNNGSQNYLNIRKTAIQASTKSKYQTPGSKNAKIKELEERYAKYRIPLSKVYAGFFTKPSATSAAEYKKAKRGFMTDHRNYRFEWGSDNSSDGAKMGDYDAPAGFEWTGTKEKPTLAKK